MKASFVIFLLLLCCALCTAQGNIISVNNNAAAGADYTSLQTAIDSADAGDIIYLYPSPTSYGSVSIAKPLTLYGPGFDLQQNPSLSVQSTFGNAIISNIILSSGADGGLIQGCQISQITASSVNNYQVYRNKITNRLEFSNGANVKISSNFFTAGYVGSNRSHTTLTYIQSAIISNNIYSNWDQFGSNQFASGSNCNSRTDNLAVGASSGVVIENNYFRDRIIANDCLIKNNIFFHSTDAWNGGSCDYPIIGSGYQATNNVLNYGRDYGSTNQSGIHRDSVFLGYPSIGQYSFDSRYQLSPNSPARGAGVNGVDCGPFGGEEPYQLSGLPPIPLIYEIDAPATGTAAGGLQVTIKARAID